MTAINAALMNISPGEAQSFANLEITPLLAGEPGQADYLTLSAAQESGLAEVTEVSESGSVPTLLFRNKSDRAVFLLDGEELVGAKQNRVINLSLLAPAGADMEIPVSCVEEGRWSHRTREFASSHHAMFSRGRARQAARVSENLRAAGSHRSDQGAVWRDVSDKMIRMSVHSDTMAISDAFDSFSTSLDEYVDAFTVAGEQVGACFSINGELVGMELFDASATCQELMPKLIRSYAFDAIDEKQEGSAASNADVQAFVNEVAAASVDSFESLGKGQDLRIDSPGVVGGALEVDGKVVHLCAFRQAEGDAPGSSRMRRASERRRRRYMTDHGPERD